LITTLAGTGFGDGDAACPGDAGSGQASPATTVTACVPSGGTDGPLVGDGADGDTDGDGTGGADVTDGDPLPGFGGTSDAGPTVAAELTGVAEVGALGSCVLAGADGVRITL
jgi:hypothetical protein